MNQPRARARQDRSIRNDARIIDAAFTLTSERGWAGLTFPGVAERSGLSLRPVRDRFADRSELAAAVWVERVAPALASTITSLIEAHASIVDGRPHDGNALANALIPFTRPSAELRAAAELIIVSGYDPLVQGAIGRSTCPALRDWIRPRHGAISRAESARRAYLLSTALGLLAQGLNWPTGELDLTPEFLKVAAALGADREPVEQPSNSADYLDRGADFNTGDPAWDALLQATLDQVGARGYEAATTAAIARASGYTEGLLFGRYASKQDLFFDASRRMIGSATRLNADYQREIAASSSPGMSEAVMIREFMRPGREHLRIISLEQHRLGWHDAEFQSAINSLQEPVVQEFIAQSGQADPQRALASVHLEFAGGIGPVLLAQLLPETWDLPYDVVTIPLLEPTVA